MAFQLKAKLLVFYPLLEWSKEGPIFKQLKMFVAPIFKVKMEMQLVTLKATMSMV